MKRIRIALLSMTTLLLTALLLAAPLAAQTVGEPAPDFELLVADAGK